MAVSKLCGGANAGVSGSTVTGVPAVTSCHSNRATTASPPSLSRTVAARRTPPLVLTRGSIPASQPTRRDVPAALSPSGTAGTELWLTTRLVAATSSFLQYSVQYSLVTKPNVTPPQPAFAQACIFPVTGKTIDWAPQPLPFCVLSSSARPWLQSVRPPSATPAGMALARYSVTGRELQSYEWATQVLTLAARMCVLATWPMENSKNPRQTPLQHSGLRPTRATPPRLSYDPLSEFAYAQRPRGAVICGSIYTGRVRSGSASSFGSASSTSSRPATRMPTAALRAASPGPSTVDDPPVESHITASLTASSVAPSAATTSAPPSGRARTEGPDTTSGLRRSAGSASAARVRTTNVYDSPDGSARTRRSIPGRRSG